MPDQEDIDEQLSLLTIHRRTLADWLAMQARLSVHTPPYVLHGIREARANIWRVKETLRGWDVSVTDLPENVAADNPAEQSPAQATHGSRGVTIGNNAIGNIIITGDNNKI